MCEAYHRRMTRSLPALLWGTCWQPAYQLWKRVGVWASRCLMMRQRSHCWRRLVAIGFYSWWKTSCDEHLLPALWWSSYHFVVNVWEYACLCLAFYPLDRSGLPYLLAWGLYTALKLLHGIGCLLRRDDASFFNWATFVPGRYSISVV